MTEGSRRLRVLQVIDSLDAGGAEALAVSLACGLDRDRFDVTLCSLFDAHGAPLEQQLVASRVPIEFLGKRLGFDPKTLARAFKLLRRVRPDVVHTHCGSLRYLFLASLVARRGRVVHTVHNLAPFETEFPAFNRVAFAMGVLPISIGDAVRKSVHSLYGIEHTPVIPNGIDVARFVASPQTRETTRRALGAEPTDRVVLNVGRLAAQKNHRCLIRAFARLAGDDANAVLFLVGDGPLRASVAAEIARLGLEERVHLLGSRTDVPALLAASDLFVLSSTHEGSPLSILEAMAAGVATVSADVGCVSEQIVDGESGVLVPSDDPKALARAMGALLGDPARRSRLATAARERVRDHFDVAGMVTRYETLYSR